jgi:hypothetical protein
MFDFSRSSSSFTPHRLLSYLSNFLPLKFFLKADCVEAASFSMLSNCYSSNCKLRFPSPNLGKKCATKLTTVEIICGVEGAVV